MINWHQARHRSENTEKEIFLKVIIFIEKKQQALRLFCRGVNLET